MGEKIRRVSLCIIKEVRFIRREWLIVLSFVERLDKKVMENVYWV